MRFIPVATLVSAFLLLPTLGRVPGVGLFAQTPPELSVTTQAVEDDEAPCATDALPIHLWSYENAEAEWSDVAISITMRDPFSVYAQSVPAPAFLAEPPPNVGASEWLEPLPAAYRRCDRLA